MKTDDLKLRTIKKYKEMLDLYNADLLELSKSQKTYDINELNTGTMEVELISLPQQSYTSDISYINANTDLDHIKLQMQHLEDDEMLKVNENKELKNQAQRDTALRVNLFKNELYSLLYVLKQTILQTQNICKARIKYFDGIGSNIKKIYYLRNELVLADKNTKENKQVIENEQ